jgi:fibronectin type 3 domain-containing protein
LGTAFPSTTVQLPVTWSAVTAFTNGAAVTIPLTYNIYRGPSTTALVQIGSSTTLGYTDTAVAAGTTYFYAITATCTGCTESAKSVVVSGVPVVQTLTPLAPTGVIAK